MFRPQFEARARHNNGAPWEKGMHLSAVLQGQTADILHGVPAEATCEDIVEVLESLYGDDQLTAMYRSKLIGESLQRFATATEQ
jgi:uncharacterized Fe-S cluster-containing protein